MFVGTIVGNLTKDIELRTANVKGEPRSVCDFTVASNRVGSEEADYVKVTAWGKQAENCAKYLKKGSAVAVTGNIEIQRYESDKGKGVEVKISGQIQFLDRKKKSGEIEAPAASDEDMPF